MCRKDGVHTNAAAAPFGAEFAGHLRDCTHGHAVCDVTATESSHARERADAHDAPAAAGKHPATGFLAHAKATEHKIAPRLLDGGKFYIFRGREHGVACDVAEEIDTTELGVELREQHADLLGHRDVALCKNHSTPQLANVLRGGFGPVGIEVHNHQVCSCFRKRQSHRPAHSLRGTRHDGNFS